MTRGQLYRTFYVLIHTLYTFYQWLRAVQDVIYDCFVDLSHEFKGAGDFGALQIYIDNSNKKPRHLTVLLGCEEPRYKDLANIVLWCLVNRIVFLSFYDYKGTLTKHRDEFESVINKKLAPRDRVIWHCTDSNHKNGFTGRKVHVKILTKDHGKGAIAKLARQLSKNPPEDKLSIEFLDTKLQKDFEFPDPDMGLHCGELLKSLDYPPWQLRITEFFTVKSHTKLAYRTFLHKLYHYVQCEQRLGK
ncbi:hypothetical protein ABEB36_006293 [Hypothenemus hampei]|uniref:ditrans,polycis-polyprenyl diphosphate synthase [(2E,6E)-farnesyldiphosphate specific] n=1 Tax=Hypothenemus hampei TaxID=57062 RepID=A0ABD1EQ19_HYPHA